MHEIRLAGHGDLPHNLPLGVNASRMSITFDHAQLESDEAWAAVSRSADFGEPYPVDLPA